MSESNTRTLPPVSPAPQDLDDFIFHWEGISHHQRTLGRPLSGALPFQTVSLALWHGLRYNKGTHFLSPGYCPRQRRLLMSDQTIHLL